MTTSEIITARNEIANLALAGDTRYSFDPIGETDGDINDMADETDLTLVYRATSTSDVAVYSDGERHVLVCDAHGPISIYVSGGAA
jgi:hypothetical protein